MRAFQDKVYAETALNELLKDEAVKTPFAKAIGCGVRRKKKVFVYNKEMACKGLSSSPSSSPLPSSSFHQYGFWLKKDCRTPLQWCAICLAGR